MSRYPDSPATFREFHQMFPDDAACVAYLASWRWPDGFVCPACSSRRHCRLRTRPLWECLDCGHQASVTAGTVLHRTRLPLTTWLYAIWVLAVRRTSVSALQLQRETGIGSYKSAWGLLHKVRRVLGESEAYKLHRGVVEVDESKVGCRGRGVARAMPPGGAWVVAAVERVVVERGERRWLASGSARVEVIPDTRGETLRPFVHRSVRPGATVVTDGWSPYRKLAGQGYVHEAHVLHDDRAVVEAVQPKVHLLFSNAKTWLNGTFHGVSARYLGGYLAEFTYRFNRRRRKQSIFGFVARRVMRGSWTSFEGLKPEATA